MLSLPCLDRSCSCHASPIGIRDVLFTDHTSGGTLLRRMSLDPLPGFSTILINRSDRNVEFLLPLLVALEDDNYQFNVPDNRSLVAVPLLQMSPATIGPTIEATAQPLATIRHSGPTLVGKCKLELQSSFTLCAQCRRGRQNAEGGIVGDPSLPLPQLLS